MNLNRKNFTSEYDMVHVFIDVQMYDFDVFVATDLGFFGNIEQL
jgi:hypothetical protein